MVEPHQHVVPFVRRAVAHDKPKSTASSTVARTQTSVSDPETMSASASLDQPGLGEGGIAGFVETLAGGHSAASGYISSSSRRSRTSRVATRQRVYRRHMPGIWSGRPGGMKRKTILSG